jgi:hypothetical protein
MSIEDEHIHASSIICYKPSIYNTKSWKRVFQKFASTYKTAVNNDIKIQNL